MIWPFSSSTTSSTAHYSTTGSNTSNNSPIKASPQKTPEQLDQLRNAPRALNHDELNAVLRDTGRRIREAIDNHNL